MKISFNAHEGLVLIGTEIEGPSGNVVLQFALDTGATSTLINIGVLVAIGYDPAISPERVQITTGSGVEFVPRITLQKITALGQERSNFAVVCHTLPPSAGIDGILGLDFLRGQQLTIDFRQGHLLFV